MFKNKLVQFAINQALTSVPAALILGIAEATIAYAKPNIDLKSAAELFQMDFHGYFRSGVGASTNGDMQTWAKQKVGRLGNEDDTYGEIELGWKANDLFRINSMVAMSSNGSNTWESTGTVCNFDAKQCQDDAVFALRQFNVQATNLFGNNEILWAGKRYYKRRDIHISDFYYWNLSGAGAGIENIPAGPGKLSLAWIRNDRSSNDVFGKPAGQPNLTDDVNVNTVDIRYTEIPLWNDSAKLDFGIDYAIVNATAAQRKLNSDMQNGVMLTAELTLGVLGGNNHTILQYGTEGYAKTMAFYGDGSWYGAEAKNGADGYRIINWGVIPVGNKVAIGHQLVYGVGNEMWNENDQWKTWSAVMRAVYKWGKWNELHQKTIVEIGYFQDQNTTFAGTSERDGGYKLTLAQAWSAESDFFNRPEIRIFASYLQNVEGKNRFDDGTAKNAWNFGVQAEAWW